MEGYLVDIYNCHLHLFTIEHVPDRFLPPCLMYLAKHSWSRRALTWILRHFDPLSNRNIFERYARFIKITADKSQADTFEVVRSYYPTGTRFVVLPKDMSLMGAGEVAENIFKQHKEMAALRDRFPDLIFPFAAVDPRRSDVPKVLAHAVCEMKFKGVKLYPPLGYRPDDPTLMDFVYPFCLEHDLPVTAHYSRGGVCEKGKPDSAANTDSDLWLPVLEKYPLLKLCLAQFGGIDTWHNYLDSPWPQ